MTHKTDITNKATSELRKLRLAFPNGYVKTIAGRIYWCWENQNNENQEEE